MTNETTAAANVAAATPEDQLLNIEQQMSEAKLQLRNIDADAPEFEQQLSKILKLQQEHKAAVANLEKAKRELEAAEARAKRTKLADDLADAAANMALVNADKKATDEAKQAAKLAFDAAREIVVNELLAKFGGATRTSNPSTSGGTATRGATGQQIVELFKQHRAAGMTDTDAVKAIIAAGFSRGTTGAVVLDYQRQIGEKPPKA